MSSAAPTDPTFSPAQILHALMLSCIYPLLQNQHTGPLDPMMARSAAVELLKTFRIRDTLELFACTQIMSFGLAALDSLGLAKTQGLSPSMVLRCRGNANGLQRTAQQAQRALEQHRAVVDAQRAREAALAQAPDLATAQAEAAARVAETERLLAAARARTHATTNQAPPHRASNPTTHTYAAATPPTPTYRTAALSSTAAYLAAPPPSAFLSPTPSAAA